MKIAVVHDWLSQLAGAERVLEQILLLYPDAVLFALVDAVPPAQRGFLTNREVRTTFLQKVPLARRHYRHFLPLMPLAIEQLDLSGFDLIISSSHAVAKGVLTGPDQLHISYIHSPMRYAWDQQHQYLRQHGLERGPLSWLVRWQLHRLRLWDRSTANGIDRMVANSAFIAGRIRKIYRREATVIHPPVDVDTFTPGATRSREFYLTASRAVSQKRIDLIVDAFAQLPGRRLVVIGDGPELKSLRRRAPANVTFLGYQPAPVLRDYLRDARAFIFAAEEDFGIVPVEAQACGTPVIAFGRGGVRETVIPLEVVTPLSATVAGVGRIGSGAEPQAPTGVFFERQDSTALLAALHHFEAEEHRFDSAVIRAQAERFSTQRFREELATLVTRSWDRRQENCSDLPG
ncbi:MAG TPA: glycosyltransferase family 4 protein [Porticoccaceae bacterium]|nr:glycosyltransferase family 4 protein [Porticoccaceae bacterium]